MDAAETTIHRFWCREHVLPLLPCAQTHTHPARLSAGLSQEQLTKAIRSELTEKIAAHPTVVTSLFSVPLTTSYTLQQIARRTNGTLSVHSQSQSGTVFTANTSKAVSTSSLSAHQRWLLEAECTLPDA